jgi:hypothetical protein
LLGVILQKSKALFADAVDVRRLVAHQPIAIGADICKTDVVAENDENIGLYPPAAGKGGLLMVARFFCLSGGC